MLQALFLVACATSTDYPQQLQADCNFGVQPVTINTKEDKNRIMLDGAILVFQCHEIIK